MPLRYRLCLSAETTYKFTNSHAMQSCRLVPVGASVRLTLLLTKSLQAETDFHTRWPCRVLTFDLTEPKPPDASARSSSCSVCSAGPSLICWSHKHRCKHYYASALKQCFCLTLTSDVCLTSVWRRLSRTSGLSREQRCLWKTKIATEVAHVTRDSDTTFKVKKDKVTGAGHIVAASRTACYYASAP